MAGRGAAPTTTQDWERFYHYPYVYYPQNFWGNEYYRSADSLYYRYPAEMRIPVYNRHWHNEYPSPRKYLQREPLRSRCFLDHRPGDFGQPNLCVIVWGDTRGRAGTIGNEDLTSRGTGARPGAAALFFERVLRVEILTRSAIAARLVRSDRKGRSRVAVRPLR